MCLLTTAIIKTMVKTKYGKNNHSILAIMKKMFILDNKCAIKCAIKKNLL